MSVCSLGEPVIHLTLAASQQRWFSSEAHGKLFGQELCNFFRFAKSCLYLNMEKGKRRWTLRIPSQNIHEKRSVNNFKLKVNFGKTEKITKFSLKNHFFFEKIIRFQGVVLKNVYFLRAFFCKILLWKRLRRGCEIAYVVHKTWKMMQKRHFV